MDDINFERLGAGKLIGGKVVGLASSPPDEFGMEYAGLVIENKGKKLILWFLQDEEDNGPGTFEVQEGGG